jgi:hypothetical protein
MSLRCKLNLHAFNETDEFGRIWCERCGVRKPVRFAQIMDDALLGRQLNRPKTRKQRSWK